MNLASTYHYPFLFKIFRIILIERVTETEKTSHSLESFHLCYSFSLKVILGKYIEVDYNKRGINLHTHTH